MRTVELLLDTRLEAVVRDLWRRLRDAGLPSLATHPHPTNRPHLTLLTATSLAGLPAPLLPLAAELGPVRMLGRALILGVQPTDVLRSMHARTWSALSGMQPWPSPEQWVPHVSLALKVPADRQAQALDLLSAVPVEHGHFVSARSYDTATRTTVDL
ncbi:2'-5' RNA ligase family protein [Actinoplanes sp. NPDC051494]|uniref:2'-5' RNA ligase family protein n=1 Tax=Actinoplanes sp. NPDC051494 TaxID=3363907 RepID=UPI0037A1241F